MNQAYQNYQVQPQVPVYYQNDAEKKDIFNLKNVVFASVAIIATLLIIIAVIVSNKSQTFDARSVQVREAKSNDSGINSFEPPKKTVSSTPVTGDETNANEPSITEKQNNLSFAEQPEAYPDNKFNTAPSNYNSSSISAPVTDSLADASIDDATDDIVAVDLIDVKLEKTIPESFFDMEIDLLVFFDKVQEIASCLCNIYSYDPSNMELKVVNTFKVNSSCIAIDLIISSDRKKIAFYHNGSIYLRNVTDKSDFESKSVLNRFEENMGLISDLCFSPNGEEIGFVSTSCRSRGLFADMLEPQIFKINIVDLNVDKLKESLVQISDFKERRNLRNLTFVSDELFAFRTLFSSHLSLLNIQNKTITDLKSLSDSDSNNNRVLHYFIYSEESQAKIILVERHNKEIQIFSVSIDSIEKIVENESNNQTSLLPIERVNLAVINEMVLSPILSSKGNFILYKLHKSEIYKVAPLKPSALAGLDDNSVESSESKSILGIQILDLKSADQN